MEHPSQLTALVRACLSSSPIRVGARMRPERELAVTFHLGRRKVREAIEELVQAQILVREHGSGVYVRKVPPKSEGARDPSSAEGGEALFEKLFVTDQRRSRLQIPEAKRALCFEAWWKTAFANDTARLFRQGLCDQAKALGHRLNIHDVPSGRDANLAAAQMLASVSREPCDGYIIHVPFAEACDRIDSLLAAPVIYVSTGRQPLRHQPMIRLDGSESIFLSLERLHAEGYRRIGLLNLQVEHESQALYSQEVFYKMAVEKMNLRFSRSVYARNDPDAVARALKELLAPSRPCDALYITDDYIAALAEPLLKEAGLRPGENFGVITLANRGSDVLKGSHWSRMEFDPYNNGKLAINCLIRSVETAGEELLSFSHHPAWLPGATHLSARPHPRG